MSGVFIPGKKAGELSKDFIEKVSREDPETMEKIESDKILQRWLTTYELTYGTPKSFVKKIYE